MFYIFGSLGVVWFALWFRKAASGPTNDPRVSDKEREYIVANTCEQVCKPHVRGALTARRVSSCTGAIFGLP